VGAAQPGTAATTHRHGYADPDHRAAEPDPNHDRTAPTVRATDAAMPAAAALLPSKREPDNITAAATAAGARSGADFAATRQLTSLTSEIHRYTGVP